MPGNAVDGNSAVPAEGACGTRAPRHSQNPSPARPWLLLQHFSPPFLSPFRKLRNKNPMLNAIPCVALRTCCRMYLHSPEEGGGSSSSPVFQPLHVQGGAPALLGEKIGKPLSLEYFCTFLSMIKPCLLACTGIYFSLNTLYSSEPRTHLV